MHIKFWLENLKGRELVRPRRRWNGIRMDLREIGWEGVDWMHVAQDRKQWRGVTKTVLDIWVL
jgi:23S rRNA A1618 N6-methylase RlmF